QSTGHSVNNEVSSARPPGDSAYSDLTSLTEIIDADEIDTSQQLILDARELPRYRGEAEPIDPVTGHIPGALCSPFSGNLDDYGHFHTIENLRKKFSMAAKSNLPIVCYCGSGVTAAHNILAMNIAGIDNSILYPGSWSEWITDPSRLIATGDGN
ncbi:MAG: sulfurtransferase, partial [Pseudomonadales bacterium]